MALSRSNNWRVWSLGFAVEIEFSGPLFSGFIKYEKDGEFCRPFLYCSCKFKYSNIIINFSILLLDSVMTIKKLEIVTFQSHFWSRHVAYDAFTASSFRVCGCHGQFFVDSLALSS